MDKYVVLLPLHYNNGTRVPRSEIKAAIDALYALAGGHTLEGHGKGAYRMKSGKKQEDELLKVSVALAEGLDDELRTMVRGFCRRFDQECIWLEKSNSNIELVEPTASQGDDHE